MPITTNFKNKNDDSPSLWDWIILLSILLLKIAVPLLFIAALIKYVFSL